MMFKKSILVAVAAIFLAGIFLIPSPTVVQAAEPIKIGAVLTVTGRGSFLGDPEKKSLLIYVKALNAAGGINGRPIKLFVEDDEGKADKCSEAVQRLLMRDKVVAIIGPSLSGLSMRIIGLVQKAQTPNISCAASIKIVKPVKKWVFKTPQTDTMAVEAIYIHAKMKGYKKVALLTVNSGFGYSGLAQLKRLAPKYGMKIVAAERFGGKDNDMTAQLTRIKGKKPDYIVGWTIGPTQVTIVRNWAQLGMKNIPFYQSHGWGSPRNLTASGAAANGVLAPLGRIVVVDQLPASDPLKAFDLHYVKAWKQYYPKTAVSTFGGHAWDAIHMLVAAIKKVGTNKAKIRDYLENNIKNFPGTGGMFNMSPTDHCGLNYKAFVMTQVVNGKWKIVYVF
ncbi:MAG: ABC transporter substrate-binding protein [Proteobacteria bacterium]|nr:ABC transporter substrate-binding protein [Pseudomonadota bacterium]MBU1741342.1 ABC transporter substrate-binding protein [Pseudomonadota bacterium]